GAPPPLAAAGLLPLSLYSGSALLALFFLLALLVNCAIGITVAEDVDLHDFVTALLLSPLTAVPLFLLARIIESGLVAVGIPPDGGLGAEDGLLSSMRVSVAVLLVLVGTVAPWGILHATRSAVLAATHRGRYLVERDFGGWPPTVEARTMAAVQQAVDRVREGAEVLGDSFDRRAALTLLREQEWRIAQDLVRHRRHRLELEERRREAVSERVREALRPQEEAVRASWGAITERADAVIDYGRSVHDAVVAHREWEQCEEITRSNDSYADLVASSTSGTLDTEALAADTTQLRAAREARDERVREAMRAGEWLTHALR
ncbi:hypothetical protein, partial [Thermobifida halotolerans]|uniref:hypothetical protein n=1 Tax=Thermobifida halotolerans TaxID=483545 RepID=UPI000837CCEC